MDWKCSKCGRELKTYDDQTALMGQLEGLVCPGCGIAVCDTCHPTLANRLIHSRDQAQGETVWWHCFLQRPSGSPSDAFNWVL